MAARRPNNLTIINNLKIIREDTRAKCPLRVWHKRAHSHEMSKLYAPHVRRPSLSALRRVCK